MAVGIGITRPCGLFECFIVVDCYDGRFVVRVIFINKALKRDKRGVILTLCN